MPQNSRTRLVLGVLASLVAVGTTAAARATKVRAPSVSCCANCTRCRRPPRCRCLRRLPATSASPRFRTIAPLPIQSEPAQCATIDLVRLDRILMPDQTVVAVNPPPTLLCSMAEQVAEFIRADVGPAAAALGAPLASVAEAESYECRSRNNIPGARLSEHGRGNALDISAIKLRNGALFTLTDPLVAKPFRERMRALACARFTTVLGPGSDGYHEEHIHLDLGGRSNGYRICQWNVLDPAPVSAEIPLPRPRPMNLTSDQTQSRRRIRTKENGAGPGSAPLVLI